MERFLPLAIVGVWALAFRWRVRVHRLRHGASPMVPREKSAPRERLLIRVGGLGFFLTAAQAVLVAAGWIPWAEGAIARSAGIALALGGQALLTLAQVTMGAAWRVGIDPDARGPLVTTGLFALTRNPIYAAIALQFAGMALLIPNVVQIGVAVGVALGVWRQARVEEAWMLSIRGADYRAYAARVGRFVPGLGRIRQHDFGP